MRRGRHCGFNLSHWQAVILYDAEYAEPGKYSADDEPDNTNIAAIVGTEHGKNCEKPKKY